MLLVNEPVQYKTSCMHTLPCFPKNRDEILNKWALFVITAMSVLGIMHDALTCISIFFSAFLVDLPRRFRKATDEAKRKACLPLYSRITSFLQAYNVEITSFQCCCDISEVM